MKTLQELYKEVIASDELKNEFVNAAKDEENAKKNVEEFLKKHGCDATFEELQLFFEGKAEEELSEEEMEAVAGGKKYEDIHPGARVAISIIGVIFACLIH